MLRHILILLLVFLAAGCGDTYREQLVHDYQRLVVNTTDETQLAKVCKQVIKVEFGQVREGKIPNSYVSTPAKFVDDRSGRTGKAVCYLTFIPYDTYSEVFVQVSRHVVQPGSYRESYYSSDFKGNSHSLATPMESGENLPASRKVIWMNFGRDRSRENRILTMIKDKTGEVKSE